MSDTHELYPLSRDEVESNRLNAQHKFLVHAVGGLISSTIPLEHITTVADVGTGTGIWLLEAQNHLNAKATPNPSRSFHGFDISPAQFVPSPPQGIELSVQDILKPFPPEHHGRYDLVNVRMLVTALAETEYRTAVENLVAILKPGGYIQWVELDNSALSRPHSQHPKAAALVSSWLGFFAANGLSVNAPASVEDAYWHSSLMDIVNTSFALDGRGEELKRRAQGWQREAFSAVVVNLMRRTGGRDGDIEKAKEKADQAMNGLEGFFEEGRVLGLRFGCVVGRRV
ncbi:hypothetical protein BDW62DRAFT_202785 [Aspergillus aurantiobrunneus]